MGKSELHSEWGFQRGMHPVALPIRLKGHDPSWQPRDRVKPLARPVNTGIEILQTPFQIDNF